MLYIQFGKLESELHGLEVQINFENSFIFMYSIKFGFCIKLSCSFNNALEYISIANKLRLNVLVLVTLQNAKLLKS